MVLIDPATTKAYEKIIRLSRGILLPISPFSVPFFTFQAIRSGYVHPNLNVDNPDVLVVRHTYIHTHIYIFMHRNDLLYVFDVYTCWETIYR